MERITQAIIGAIERGLVPDAVTRSLVRRLCQQRLTELEQSTVSVAQFADQMRQGPIAPVPEKANEQHYELPAVFFQLMLGPNLKYSCCLFDQRGDNLEQAENAALAASCERAQLTDGMNILELGCGWGSLTLWMLNNYPNSTVTAVSNSRFQRELILQRARRAGAQERLTVLTADMNDFCIDKKFDRVVSCEMFEHMRNYHQLLQKVRGWLKPDGKLFVHIFCHQKFIYEFQTGGANNWMGRYFFTGGIMPSANIFQMFTDHMSVIQAWTWSGVHYEQTCNEWLKLLDANRGAAMEILTRAYGNQAKRWFQRWRLFLIAGAELFGFQQGQQWQVGHYLLEPATAVE